MFVVDALIANPNRNSSNWGLCYDEQTDTQCIAPVFACSSSLFEKASTELMSSVLGSSQELKSLIYDEPTSALLLNGKHINYYDFITSLKYEDCNEAIKRIVPKINLQAIQDMINDIPCINDIQKRFYITIINERKEKILDKAYELLMNR